MSLRITGKYYKKIGKRVAGGQGCAFACENFAKFSHANFYKMRIFAKCEFAQNANVSHANFRKMRIYANYEL
jgi:hypothetical protein